MSIIELLNLDPQAVVNYLSKYNIAVTVDTVEKVILLLIFASALAIFMGAVAAIKKWGAAILTYFNRTIKWRRKYIKDSLEHFYGDYLTPERQRCYVPTQCQGTPPHNFDEPDEAVTSSPKQELISFFIEDVFKASNTNRRLYCILAGSGMGKTTFAVQLFIEYINKYKPSTLPYDIYIRDLGEAKVIDEIHALSQKVGDSAHKSILILDALDENLNASENFEEFRIKLEEAIKPFKFVVITCRSQFFSNEQDIPVNSNIRINTTDKNLLNYNKIYICPFSPDDINLYIKKKYKGYGKKNRRMRKQAKTIIERCKHLMARPVLLSYIDDLIDVNKDYATETEIYETLIDKWLKREVNSIPDVETQKKSYEELVTFSKKLASQIYQNWRETGDFRLEATQMDDFFRKNSFDKSKYQFRRRSLINHDANGAFKFSHKSFLEFFLAKQYFEDSSFDFSFEGMDMAKLFYKGCCIREYREKPDGVFSIKTISNSKYLLPHDEYSLVIARKSAFDFTHLFYVIEPEHFSELELNWKAYDTNIQTFIEKSGIHTITITNYRKGDGSLRQVLKGADLEFISIEGDALTKTFIKDAERKGIHVLLNNQTILQGHNPSYNSTLRLQLRLQMEKQIRLIQKERFIDSRKSIEDFLNEISKEEGVNYEF